MHKGLIYINSSSFSLMLMCFVYKIMKTKVDFKITK